MKNPAVYVFLAFAAVAVIGMVHTMLTGDATGQAYRGLPMQDYPLDPSQFPILDQGAYGGYIPPQDQPGRYMIGTPGSITDCQSQCFGTEPGRPRIGQEGLGGAALRECLANCQAGIPPEQHNQQECYTCSCPAEKITANDGSQALTVCKQVCGSEATVVSAAMGACQY